MKGLFEELSVTSRHHDCVALLAEAAIHLIVTRLTTDGVIRDEGAAASLLKAGSEDESMTVRYELKSTA